MYAPSRIAQRIDQAQREFNVTLEHHSIADIQAFEDHLKRHNMYSLDQNGAPKGTQNLTQFEHDWILNEQLLVSCDAAYALTRYAYLKDDDGTIHRFNFRVPQRIFYDIISDLEASGRTLEFIILKARQLGMCLDPDTRVLTSNLEWKRIKDVRIGDELVSVDENPAGGKGNHRRMRKAIVEARNEVIEPVIRICTEDGRGLYATKQHRFMCKVRGNSATEWRMSEDLRIGDEIRWVTSRWEEPNYEDGWFGGLLDGEGSLRPKSRAGSELCVSQIPGPVLERAKSYLDTNGYHYREEIDDRVGGSSSKFGNKPVHKLVIGRMDEIFRIIGQTRPSRLLAKEWWEGKELPGKKAGTGWAKVKSVENLLERRSMIDLQTSTKTFIAEGFVSHNSTLVELLIGIRIVFGYGVNAVIGSADQTKTAEMAKMIRLFYDYLPVWLRPELTRKVESDRGLMGFGKCQTSVSFQHGAQMSGIARGTTPTIYHLSEVATYTDAENQIESSLLRAVHASPNVFGALESSGEGDKGWWPDRWRSSRDFWHKRAARHCPLFLPWFCGVEMYPKKQWIDYDFPIPENWYPNQDTREHIAKCELYVDSNQLLKKHLVEDQHRRGVHSGLRWRMPKEQQWFWEFGHEEAKRGGTTAKWYQEMCLSAETRVSNEKGIIRIDEARGTEESESGKILAWLPKGSRHLWMMETEDGRRLKATPDHRIALINDTYKELCDLVLGDKLKLLPPRFAATQYVHRWNYTPTCEMSISVTPRLGRLLGYFMGDGDYYAGRFGVSVDAKDLDIVEDIQSLFMEFLGEQANVTKVGQMFRLIKNNVRWGEILKVLGCLEPAFHRNIDRNCGWKRHVCVPEVIFRSPRYVIREFLSTIFECDGHAYRESARVVVWSKWDNFLRDIQLLLLGFGIRSRFSTLEKKSGEGHTYTGRALSIPAAHVNKFYDEIGFISSRKQNGGKRRLNVTDGRGNRFTALEDKVTKIYPLAEEGPVYDLTIENTHYFSANGIQVHNCADDEEALQHSITSAFSHQTLAEIETRREKVFDMFCIVGQSIEADHEPPTEYIDYDKPRIPIKYTNTRDETYRWELIPLLEKQIQPNAKDAGTATGILFIWAHPQPGVRYSIGVDTAAGRGEDSTAISIWALGKNDDDPDTQVAELASSYINHAEAFAFVLGIAAYYGMYMKEFAGKWREPYVSIEQLASVGDMCQKDMSSMGYSHFHMMSRYDGKNPRRDKAVARKRGFFTGTWSREALTSYFAVCAKNLWLIINSPWLLEEMRTFEAKVTATGRTKLEHEDGKHDDRVFAAAMACFCPHDLEPIAARSKKRSVNPTTLPPLNLQPSRPSNVFSPKDMTQSEIATVEELAYSMDQMERYK